MWEWCQPQRDAALLLAKRARESAASGTAFEAPVRFRGVPASLTFLCAPASLPWPAQHGPALSWLA